MYIHSDPYVPKEIAKKNSCILHSDINSVFSMCTHISIHCNLTEETYHLVNTERIDLMPGIETMESLVAIIWSIVQRGGIVDESAALQAWKAVNYLALHWMFLRRNLLL